MARLHEGEVDIDGDLVKALLKSQFPQYAGEPIEFVDTSGTVNVIYRLGEDKCVRLPRVQRYADHLALELEWLPRLAPHITLPMPRSVATGEPEAGYPFSWAIYEWLPGDQLDADVTGYSMHTAELLAGFVAELHDVNVDGAPRSTRDAPMRRFDRLVRDSLDQIRSHAMPVDVDRALEIWEDAMTLPGWSGNASWIHGDLLPVNLLSQRDELSAVIDFGLAGVGDPAVDIIPAWSVLRGEARSVFRNHLDVDDETWNRGRAFALRQALLIIPYYRETHTAFVNMAIRTTEEVVEDAAND